ncbi:putative Kinesin-like protein KIFC3 [Cocos nucifera]|uniref:Putative Kinesin-like protein KIFC3 n=1 Tax=Cocos nucifera TaxID=13894 RepID=A0A8K0IVE7_COCNU|nr:putative Kinesin-like protein KIFC3 [Cocos nucifera]
MARSGENPPPNGAIGDSPQKEIGEAADMAETSNLNLYDSTAESFPEIWSLSGNETWEVSLDLGVIPDVLNSLLSRNGEGVDDSIVHSGIDIQKDSLYMSGVVIRIDTPIGDGKGLAPYQPDRIWNFSCKL